MDKLYALARLAAVVLAIVGAFVAVPYLAAILLILGAVAGIGIAESDRPRLYLVALVLLAGAPALGAIPQVGAYLTAVFGGLGTAFVGASMTAIVLGLAGRIKRDWVKEAAQPATA